MAPIEESRPKTGLTISTTLFHRLSELDSHAWSTFVQLYGPVVYKWCRKDGLSEDQAADVGQEVFRAVSTSIQRFHRSPQGKFLGWLRTITRFKVADHFRQSAQNPQAVGGTAFLSVISGITSEVDVSQTESLDEPDAAEANAVVTERMLALIQSKFSQQAWTAFWETAVNGRTANDVAEELRMTAMAVRKAKSRVLGRLKSELGDLLAAE
jgi:RNA polymerase sigma-70 factor (ECF subfamily)